MDGEFQIVEAAVPKTALAVMVSGVPITSPMPQPLSTLGLSVCNGTVSGIYCPTEIPPLLASATRAFLSCYLY